MITLYSKDFSTKYGVISSLCEAFVEEERNGLFELSFIMLNTDSLFNYIKEDNIVVTNANDTLLNQKFRIYMTRKLMNNRVEVFARHISFDLMYDYIDNLSFENQSCEYALNQLFRNSNFSTHYRGYSDIVNAQNYNMSMANVLEAIGGKKGSIIDTFGTGAEILRDNENIHVLNKRGYDNEVTIEYKKNLTGFELEEDTTDLITRILPYAKYNDEETSEEITVKASYVDSDNINNYSHPYIKAIDYSSKFEEGQIPTTEKLITLAKKEYRDNKVDIPKQNFKIEFIHLSKCVGYEGLEDKISLCDTVTIKDTRYNINTQAKVIKTVFNVLKNRYESMELGEPRTSLGDIIGNGGDNEPIVGPPGPQGPPGQDGSVEDFPNTLPSTPVLESFVYGFSNIELSWTFENKVYYSYELYGSKTKDFKPNTFDLIFEGQASTYMFQAKPNETWYFRVCAINTHGERTNFSNQVTVTTTKIEDLSNYVENMAISEALIGTLSLDRGWIGTLKGNYIDAKQLSVTDGNGKRTLDIDSFGNVNLAPSVVQISFNGINERINMNERSMDFTSENGGRDMSLYGGQMCTFNNMNNTFLATVGSIVASNYNINGAGFLLSKHCNHFLIGRDNQWDDIFTNRAPSPTHYLDMDFDNYQIKLGLTLLTGDVNLRGNSLYDAHVGYIKDWFGFGWRHYNTGQQILSTDGTRIVTHMPISFNGNTLMNPTLYCDKYYFTDGNTAFYKDTSGALVMMNNVTWDWQGYTLHNAFIQESKLYNCVNYNSLPTGVKVDVENDIDVLIASEPISKVNEDASVEYDLNEMIKLLYSKIHTLEKEIESLKGGV